jgi:hypothetical protein
LTVDALDVALQFSATWPSSQSCPHQSRSTPGASCGNLTPNHDFSLLRAPGRVGVMLIGITSTHRVMSRPDATALRSDLSTCPRPGGLLSRPNSLTSNNSGAVDGHQLRVATAVTSRTVEGKQRWVELAEQQLDAALRPIRILLPVDHIPMFAGCVGHPRATRRSRVARRFDDLSRFRGYV